MYIEELEDMSLVYWLKQQLVEYPFISVVDGYMPDDLIIPSVAVEWDYIEGYPLELGNRNFAKERVWYIDIFAKTKGQKQALGYLLFNAVNNGIPVYDYNMGFPPDVTNQTQLGTLIPLRKKLINREIDPSMVEEMYYRTTLVLIVVYDKF